MTLKPASQIYRQTIQLSNMKEGQSSTVTIYIISLGRSIIPTLLQPLVISKYVPRIATLARNSDSTAFGYCATEVCMTRTLS